MSSSPTNSEASISAAPSIVSNASADDSSLKPALSSDDSLPTTTTTENAPIDRVETVLKAAADLSHEAVTSPLEALALACVAEKATEEQQQEQTPNIPQGPPEFTDNDVLCGRGGLTNNARGNIFFRHLVRMKQDAYLMASKREKAGVAREIVEAIKCLNPPGRFLKKDASGKWVEIGERKAREKTSQALREGAPEKRQGLKSNPPPPTNMTIAEQATLVIGQKIGQPVQIVPVPPPTTVVAPPTTQPTSTKEKQPRKLLKQATTDDPWSFSSNRARVVSDNSVGSLMEKAEQQTNAGSKRKVVPEPESPERGPRLKLLKSRVKA